MGEYVQGVPIKINDTFTVGGVPTNPTTVVYTIYVPDGTTDVYTWPGDPEITNPAAGEFELALAPPALPGVYPYDVDATGTVPVSRKDSFVVLANAGATAGVTWPVPGPCSPWVSSQDVWECCGQPTEVIDTVTCNVDFTAYAQAASEALFELSGRQFAGVCEKTVRPCSSRDMCGVQVLSRGHVIGQWDGRTWGPMAGCGCAPLDRVKLSGYPVRAIVEVKIDGAVVDPDTYRLDSRRYLTRMRDPADPDTALGWPSCQSLDLEDDQDGTFSVTYRYGIDPPFLGRQAAGELACQLYKACGANSGDCAIPSGITRLVRQGVVVEAKAFAAWGLQNGIWITGLSTVDAFLNAANPKRLMRRPVFWGPDAQPYAKKVGT